MDFYVGYRRSKESSEFFHEQSSWRSTRGLGLGPAAMMRDENNIIQWISSNSTMYSTTNSPCYQWHTDANLGKKCPLRAEITCSSGRTC